MLSAGSASPARVARIDCGAKAYDVSDFEVAFDFGPDTNNLTHNLVAGDQWIRSAAL
jgi:predicted RNase H-related nuclease YkuK (DUF458 family)